MMAILFTVIGNEIKKLNEALEFNVKVLHYEGNDTWVNDTITKETPLKARQYLQVVKHVISVLILKQDKKYYTRTRKRFDDYK